MAGIKIYGQQLAARFFTICPHTTVCDQQLHPKSPFVIMIANVLGTVYRVMWPILKVTLAMSFPISSVVRPRCDDHIGQTQDKNTGFGTRLVQSEVESPEVC